MVVSKEKLWRLKVHLVGYISLRHYLLRSTVDSGSHTVYPGKGVAGSSVRCANHPKIQISRTGHTLPPALTMGNRRKAGV